MNEKKEKRIYTIEEINDLKAWFDAQTLPQEMQIDSSAYTPNLPGTVGMLFDQAYICHENYKMLGCIRLLEKIKSNLEQQQ